MIRKNTGYQCFNLTSGGNNQPNLVLGQATNWDFSAIQISTGKLAYYMLGIVLTLYGTLTQASGTNPIPPDCLTAALVQSIEVRNTWMGTPISQQFALGAYLPLMEYLGCGYRLPRREQMSLPTTNNAYDFSRTIVVPMCIGTYPAPHHTAPLAAMFKTAQFVVNVNKQSVVQAMSANATLTSLSAQASVILAPAPSLLLAPGNYWVDYQTTAAGTQQQIQLNAFGNSPTIKGTAENDGVLALYAIGNGAGTALPLPGSFDPGTIANYEFPWRSQFKTTHPEAIMAAQFLAMGGNSKQAWDGTSAASTAFDSQGFPYINGLQTPVNPVSGGNVPMTSGLYGFPLVVPTEDLSLATVQTASATVSYFLGLSTGVFSGNNHTLAWHVSSWADNAVNNWISTVVNSGLAQTVLGTNNVKPVPQKIGSAKQSRFQPIALIAA